MKVRELNRKAIREAKFENLCREIATEVMGYHERLVEGSGTGHGWDDEYVYHVTEEDKEEEKNTIRFHPFRHRGQAIRVLEELEICVEIVGPANQINEDYKRWCVESRVAKESTKVRHNDLGKALTILIAVQREEVDHREYEWMEQFVHLGW